MNYFNETGKLLKSCLKEKVKITAATVVGFLIMGTAAFGAGNYDGEYTNKDIAELGSSKFLTGKDGNLTIDTNGSVIYLLQDLANAKDLDGLRAALAQNGLHGSYVDENNQGNYVVTGALAGKGNYNNLVNTALVAIDLKKPEYKNLTNAIRRFKTETEKGIINIGTENKQENTKTIIGGNNSPVVLGLIGGDFALGTGEISKKEKIGFNRTGNSTVTINSGNVFGASVGSTAISLGNISTKILVDISLDGEVETTIKGNTELDINGTGSAAGVTAGGIAAAIGGTSTSNVNGNTEINIDSTVDGGQHLDGITAGIFGGGMALLLLEEQLQLIQQEKLI